LTTQTDAHPRLKQLDGLRGLAALSVFFCHAVELKFNDPWSLPASPCLRVLWNGEAAVVLFFVLSGFVLTLPYVEPAHKKIDPAPFILRRITRLYPAHWFAILLALFLRAAVYSPHGLAAITTWLGTIWSTPVTGRLLLNYLVLIAPGFHHIDLDPVIWSLASEMKISLIFPAILFLVQRTRRVPYALLILAVLLACSCFGILGDVLSFFCGSYLAKYRSHLIAALGVSFWLRAAAALCAYLAFGAMGTLTSLNGNLTRAMTIAGASLILVLFLASPLLKALATSTPIAFLGDVSYSFYLTQVPIMVTVTSWLYPLTGSILLCSAVSLACCLALSYAVYRVVEVPCQNWGRRKSKPLGEAIAAFTARRHAVHENPSS
jgi:peptidoglycan/LPS O-acetylase OafA/YrhL